MNPRSALVIIGLEMLLTIAIVFMMPPCAPPAWVFSIILDSSAVWPASSRNAMTSLSSVAPWPDMILAITLSVMPSPYWTPLCMPSHMEVNCLSFWKPRDQSMCTLPCLLTSEVFSCMVLTFSTSRGK